MSCLSLIGSQCLASSSLVGPHDVHTSSKISYEYSFKPGFSSVEATYVEGGRNTVL
eukprot:c17603_g1_i2 orf=359-526(-)